MTGHWLDKHIEAQERQVEIMRKVCRPFEPAEVVELAEARRQGIGEPGIARLAEAIQTAGKLRRLRAEIAELSRREAALFERLQRLSKEL